MSKFGKSRDGNVSDYNAKELREILVVSSDRFRDELFY
jgi:hypothetical protein